MGVGGIASSIFDTYNAVEKYGADTKAAVRQSEMNQAMLGYNARQARLQGAAKQGQLLIQGGQLQAKQNLAYSNSGIDATTGTAAAVQADTAAQTQLDAQTAKNNAAREAWGFDLQKVQDKQNLTAKLAGLQREEYGSIIGGLGKFADSASSTGGGGGG